MSSISGIATRTLESENVPPHLAFTRRRSSSVKVTGPASTSRSSSVAPAPIVEKPQSLVDCHDGDLAAHSAHNQRSRDYNQSISIAPPTIIIPENAPLVCDDEGDELQQHHGHDIDGHGHGHHYNHHHHHHHHDYNHGGGIDSALALSPTSPTVDHLHPHRHGPSLSLSPTTPQLNAITSPTSGNFARAYTDPHLHKPHSHGHGHEHGVVRRSWLTNRLLALTSGSSILHSILAEKDSRRIAYFMTLNFAFMIVQAFYGYLTESLGLISDSIHMFFDCVALAVGLLAAVLSKWPPSPRFPYGFGKVETLSGFANGILLILLCIEISFEAFERIWDGSKPKRLTELFIVSTLGLLVNMVGMWAFGHHHHHGHDHNHNHSHDHDHDNENMRGIYLHVLADTLGSVSVIVSTVLTHYTGWSFWDPLASCFIAVLIFMSSVPLVKSCARRLILTVPPDAEYHLRNTLAGITAQKGVLAYAAPRFWVDDRNFETVADGHGEGHKKHDDCHDHDHKHHSHDPSHNHNHSHDHSHDHKHDDSHDHKHGHSNDHSHNSSKCNAHGDSHNKPRLLGVVHVLASRSANTDEVRYRVSRFLLRQGIDAVVQVEAEGDDSCWCGLNKAPDTPAPPLTTDKGAD